MKSPFFQWTKFKNHLRVLYAHSQARNKPLLHNNTISVREGGTKGSEGKGISQVPLRDTKSFRPDSVFRTWQIGILPAFLMEEHKGNKMCKWMEMREYHILTQSGCS